MTISILSSAGIRVPRRKIVRLLTLILKGEKPPVRVVNIIFVNDTEIRRLNRKFREKDEATDVLSFNIDNIDGPGAILGEIYISTETARRQAASDKSGYFDEILKLCCHGSLHLMGYDHVRRRDRGLMQIRETSYLEKLKKC